MSKIKVFIVVVTASLLGLVAIWRTDCFTPHRIRSPLLSMEDLSSDAKFSWPLTFRYLGRGRQAFAFESLDGQYVLKFFDREQLSLPWYVHLPIDFFRSKKARMQEKIRIYPESYRLALRYMQQETGLLIVHMGHSSIHFPTIDLISKASNHFKIDLNNIPFILQKRGVGTFFDHADEAIDQFLAIHKKRIDLCIADHDRDIEHNYAWNEGQLIYIDPARFYYDAELTKIARQREEWEKVMGPVEKWLKENAPEKLAIFKAKI